MANAITIKLDNLTKFEEAINSNPELVSQAARRIVEKGGLILASAAKKQFRQRPGGQHTAKKSGRIYYSYKSPYQAVPPKPTSRSGKLRSSIKIVTVAPVPGGWMSATGTNVPYAEYVEYGTSRMAKEPFMQFAIDKTEADIQRMAEEEWAKAMEV